MRNIIIGAVIGALLASIVAAALWPRKPVVPPAVAVKPDTVIVVKDGETTYTINYKPDPAASKELAKLKDELVGRANLIERLTGYLSEMELENQYLVDSLTRLTLDSLHGIVRVQRGPAGIAVVSYQRGLVQTWRLPVWRQRWTLLAGTDKPSVKTSRLPVDVGLAFGGEFITLQDSWIVLPEPGSWPMPHSNANVWVGLSFTRQDMNLTIGPCWDGKLKLRAALRYDRRW